MILLVRILVRLYPPRFRKTYAEDLTHAFVQRRSAVAERGWRALLGLYAWTTADLLLGAPAEWWRELRYRPHLQGPPVRIFPRSEIMNSFVQDARLAIRGFVRRPGFAVVAVVTLALGIGANTAIFSLVNRVLMEPLPYPAPDELVRIWSSNPEQDRTQYFTSPLSYWEWTERSEALADIAAAWPREVTLTDDIDTPVNLRTMSVTSNWFDILGVNAEVGRVLREEDSGIAWGSWVLVVSDGLWRTRFGADSSVIGQTVRIDGQPAEIVGVLPPGTEFPESIDLFTNFLPPRTQPAQYMDVIGRMRPGISLDEATRDLQAVARGLQEKFPNALSGWGIEMAPLFDVVVGDIRPALLMLLVATGLVLAIACANVANLLLARTESRHRELALRSALGADRGRLVRQLLTESVVLGAVGAAAGVGVALLGLRLLLGALPSTLPRIEGVGLDLPMLGVALASAVVTGLVFGLAPALQLFRVDLQSELKEGAQRLTGSTRGIHARDGLVVAQVALAVLVSVGAGLLVKTFSNLRRADPGFDPTGVATFELNLPPGPYPDITTVGDTYTRLVDNIAALPDIQLAAVTSSLPLSTPFDYLLRLAVIGEPPPREGEEPHAWYRQVSARFFEAAGIPLIRGRQFDDRDRADAPAVVIINRSLARTLFGDENPIGRRLSGIAGGFGPLGRVLNNETEIVGVVDDVRYGSLRDPAAPSLYFPLPQAPFRRMTVVIRTAGNPAVALPAVRREVQAIDANLPMSNVTTMQETVERSIARDRFAMLLVSLFGGLSLTLAAVGIYGVLSYSVAQRQQELGVRIALGASSGRVMGLVLKRTGILIGTGVSIGLAGAFLSTRAISSQLFGVTTRDPLTYVIVALLLAATGALAGYLPAFRATRISPLEAIRNE